MSHKIAIGLGVVLGLAVGATNLATAATVPIGTTVVPGASSSGVSEILGPISDSDTLSFSVSDTPYLQDGPSYGTNAAGVVTTYGQQSNTPVGGSLADTPEAMGFTYGALILTLNGVSKQVFATDAANGLGSAAPPTTLTFDETVASLFGPDVATAVNTLNYRVDDSDYSNNTGFFTVTGASTPLSAAPEPASWALMILGLGVIGTGLRYRQRQKVLRYI